ncbi:7317_t:CDS:2, partial [Funneliformis mosseae]
YAKDFGSKVEEHCIYKIHLEAINNNPNLLENRDIGATRKLARQVLNNFKVYKFFNNGISQRPKSTRIRLKAQQIRLAVEEANSDKVTGL